jgi:hypothetical protein
VLDRELVERVADLRGQVRLVAADLGQPVRVLDEADELAVLVARDLRRVPRDRARLAGEDRLGPGLAVGRDRVPAARARYRVQEDGDDREDSDGLDDVDP